MFSSLFITAIKLTENRTIVVVTTQAVKKDAPCTITITMPSGKRLEMTLIIVAEGYSTMFTPTEEGEHKVEVTYGELPVPKSPFTVMVEIAVDVSRVRVRGLETRKYWVTSLYPGPLLYPPFAESIVCHKYLLYFLAECDPCLQSA